jgi:hypothetical protein
LILWYKRKERRKTLTKKKKGKKKTPSNGKGQAHKQVSDALEQLKLTVPQAMALLQEFKIVNLQLKVANNAMVGEIQRTFQEMCARIEALEEKVFGEVQGNPVDIGGPNSEAMTLPTEQAEKDAALLKKIQEPQNEEEVQAAKSVPLGGTVGEPEESKEEDTEEPKPKPVASGSMFPRS